MRISVIQSTNSINSKYNKKNNIQKNNQAPNFKGYTYELQLGGGYCHSGGDDYFYNSPAWLQATGLQRNESDLSEREKDMMGRVRKIPPKIYIASPGEEIPEEIYKTHTHIQKNDLNLSQIRNDYINGYKNFANNAYCEIQHFEGLKKTAPESDIEYIENKLARAKKRFNVLLKMDELGGRKSALQRESSDIHSQEYVRSSYFDKKDCEKKADELLVEIEKKEKLFQIVLKGKISNLEKDKREKQLNELKEKFKKEQEGVMKWQKVMDAETARIEEIRDKEIPPIEDEMRKEFPNIEKFYKEYYPEWAD